MPSLNAYIMTEDTKVGVYDSLTFEPIQTWNVPTTNKDIEILYLTVSNDDMKIGIALGKNLPKGDQKTTELAIYSRDHNNKFSLEKLRDFDFGEPLACSCFKFSNKNNQKLLFFNTEELF